MVGHMIVKHATHDEFPYYNNCLAVLAIGASQAIFGLLTGYNLRFFHLQFISDSVQIFSYHTEIAFLYACLALVFGLHLHFILGVIDEICGYLGISCLKIRPKRHAH